MSILQPIPSNMIEVTLFAPGKAPQVFQVPEHTTVAEIAADHLASSAQSYKFVRRGTGSTVSATVAPTETVQNGDKISAVNTNQTAG